MKSFWRNALLIAAIASFTAGCGKSSSVEGNTYEATGGVVKVEFQSGGKAITSIGAMSSPCTYTQTGKAIALSCENEKIELTVNDDGSLAGPPDGFAARLNKKKA
jgi:hypothetical protein